MDPLTATSIAAAVVQFVDFTARLLTSGWRVYRSATGKNVDLLDFSVISYDLEALTTSIRKAIADGQETGALGDSAQRIYSDEQLLQLCDDCNSIAAQITGVLPLTTRYLKGEGKSHGSFWNRIYSWRVDPRPAGERFRMALEQVWKRDEIHVIVSRLAEVRTRMINEATVSVWVRSRETKKWEAQFSEKLELMNKTLVSALDSIGRVGPQAEGATSLPEASREVDFNLVTDELPNRRLAIEIQKQLWDKSWRPETLQLPQVPGRLTFSVSRGQHDIVNSLRYETMDIRKEAIVDTFESTYKWIMDPQTSGPDGQEQTFGHLPNWLSGSARDPFWITGKPGSGKSTIMKFIVNHEATGKYLSRWAGNYPLQKVSYYAWKPGMSLDKTEIGLLRSIIFQILDYDPALVAKVCSRRWALLYLFRGSPWVPFPEWTSWELAECLHSILAEADLSMRLAVFIDGLDEFEEATVRICSLIQDIARHGAVKICVASRPWPQFCDLFAESPHLDMHLLTYQDIRAYVFGQFKQNPAFMELQDLHPEGVNPLVAEIVSRAQGVFLWVTLVTQAMMERLQEGDRLTQLQVILNSMPPQIEELYDAIYATIPQRLLPEMAVLLRLVESTSPPVDWVTLWLADESRSELLPVDFNVATSKAFAAAQKVMKRRIGARTRGILELVQSSGTVEYLHRTAAEWVQQPRVTNMLRAQSPEGFDPFLCLFHAEMLRARADAGYLCANEPRRGRVLRAVLYASLVDERTIPRPTLIQQFDRYWYPSEKQGQFDGILARDTETKLALLEITEEELMQLCCIVAFVPYVHHKLKRSSTAPSHKALIVDGLAPAVWGLHSTHPFRAQYDHGSKPPFRDLQIGYRTQLEKLDKGAIPVARRLELVALLIERGSSIEGLMQEVSGAGESVPEFLTEEFASYLRQVQGIMRDHGQPKMIIGLSWLKSRAHRNKVAFGRR